MKPQTKDSRFHALLIGIDDYPLPRPPLGGCVNDIDAVAKLLMERLAIPAAAIRKLAAPVPSANRVAGPNEAAPTRARIIEELKALAGEAVQPGDRVFVYYSGHGSYEKIPAALSWFEALVPYDCTSKEQLLFDVELNQLLQAIAERSGDLTVILDSCHSAGATRDSLPRPEDYQARFLPPDTLPGTARLPDTHKGSALRSIVTSEKFQEYTVIAACHADESAVELRLPRDGGQRHGTLTYCLLKILSEDCQGDLAAVRWSDIWEKLKAEVTTLSPAQHPQLLGPASRLVFGGPWKPQDRGFPIFQNKDGTYTIVAGSLAGLGMGADVAVYGADPDLFPPLGTEADIQARVGTLRVEQVEPTSAIGRPAPRGHTFQLPPNARGRMIKPGLPDRLRVALADTVNPRLCASLSSSQEYDRFAILRDSEASAEAYVGQYPDGRLWIGDDMYGPGLPLDKSAPGPMGVVHATDPVSMAWGLRAGLNHYAQYVIPLRLCRKGGYGLGEGALEVRLIDCNDPERMAKLELDASLRQEMPRNDSGRYVLKNQDRVCILVHNTLAINLYVSLLVCSLEGHVQLLDTDVLIGKRSGKIFWFQNIKNRPFRFGFPGGYSWGIDRLISVATDQYGVDLSCLEQKQKMQEVIEEALCAKSALLKSSLNPEGVRWTAVQTVIRIGQP